jgi:hypothetical protein
VRADQRENALAFTRGIRIVILAQNPETFRSILVREVDGIPPPAL